MCDCLHNIAENIELSCIPAGATVSRHITGWSGTAINFTTGNLDLCLNYDLVYRELRKDGAPAKNLTRKKHPVKINYCPFCGDLLGGE